MSQFLRFFALLCGLLFAQSVWATASVIPPSNYYWGFGNNVTVAASPSSSAQAGDVLVAHVTTISGVSITPPTGWSKITSASYNGNSTVQSALYYFNLSTAPAASYSWTFGSNSNKYVLISIYTLRGVQALDCASASTTNCAGSYQAGGGNQITAPNIQSQPPTYPAGSVRMAFFSTDDGGVTITPQLQNSATPGVSALSGGSTAGVSINASYYLLSTDSNGDQQTATLSNNANNVGSTLVVAASPLTCLTDNFDRTSGLGSDWISSNVSGSFTPAIVSNRLRLTDAQTNESTGVIFQRLFPGAGNLVKLTFRYYGYGGSGNADGIALTLSDASVTPQPGGFGGSLGYSTRNGATSGFAGGWIGIGLDEYGNFSNKNDSGPCAASASSCATSAVSQSVSIRGSSSNYYWLKGTSSLNPTVSNNTGHLYRITIDSTQTGKSLVTVERDTGGTGSSYSTLINAYNVAAATGQTAIPTNLMLTVTGSTGSATNIHEIDDLQVCAQTMNPLVSIDHYRFTVNTLPLTCSPATVNVKACLDANCTSTYGGATATLLPTGWIGGDAKTIPLGGSDFKLSKTTAGTYTLGIVANSSTPPIKGFASASAQCSINNSGYSASNCGLVFSDSGLLLNIPAQTSGKPGSMTVSAVKASDNSLQCVPAFASVSRTVDFWSSYSNPASGSKSVLLNGSAITSSTTTLAASTASTGTAVSLSFDATGTATVPIQYDDAGQLLLNARYDGSSTTADSGLVMLGSSIFPVTPYALCVDSPDTGWQCNTTSSQAQTPGNCSIYKKAGESFNLRVSGKAYNSTAPATAICSLATTPNYIQSGIALSSSVIAPSGGSNGSLGSSSINITANGTATISQTQSEAGVFSFTATPKAGDYFTTTVPAGSSLYFGRFRPAYFTTTVTPGCNTSVSNGFTYSGQPFTTTVTAKNTVGGTTTNYSGSYALPTTLSNAGSTSNLSNNSLPASSFSSGVATSNTVTYTFPSYGYGSIILRATDTDGTTSSNPNEGTTLVESGRVRLLNAYGSELLNLPVSMSTEYWNGSAWQLNKFDTCTSASLSFTPVSSPDITSKTCVLDTGNPGKSGKGCTTAATSSLQFIRPVDTSFAGYFNLTLQKPGAGNIGTLDVTATVPGWMQYPWSSSTKTNPRSRASFGKRAGAGNAKVIHLQEIY